MASATFAAPAGAACVRGAGPAAPVRFPAVRQTDPPISPDEIERFCAWLHGAFGPRIAARLDPAIPLALAYAIASVEVGFYLVRAHPRRKSPYDVAPIDRPDFTPATILSLCVFDTSGEERGKDGAVLAPRRVFPRTKTEFTDAMGAPFTQTLVEAGARMRADLFGWGPTDRFGARWLYKGYGLFQFDLQHVRTAEHRAFFEQRQWGDVEACVDKLNGELAPRLARFGGDARAAAASYNGSLIGDANGDPVCTRFGQLQLSTWYGETVASYAAPICAAWLSRQS